MAIQENYIDKITKDGESRPISPAADKVRVDNDNFEGDNLDDVLDEIHTAIGNAGSGDGTVTGVKVGNTPYNPDGEGVVDLSTPFNAKVDKETGKSLITDAEHTKLQNLPSDPVSSISVNGQTQQKDQNGNVNIEVQGSSSIDPATATPQMDGTAAAGQSAKYAREDHVHPHDTSKQDALTSDTTIATVNGTALKFGGSVNIAQGPQGEKGDTVVLDPSQVEQFVIANNLDGDSPTDALSARQGKVLKQAVNMVMANLQAMYNALSNTAFTNLPKPTLQPINWAGGPFYANANINLVGCTGDDNTNNGLIQEGTSLVIQNITASAHYTMTGATVNVTDSQGNALTYTYANGTLTVANVVGTVNVSIAAVATEWTVEVPNVVGMNIKKDGLSVNGSTLVVQLNDPLNLSVEAVEGYFVKSVNVTMGGEEVVGAYANGEINIASVTGNVVITAVAASLNMVFTGVLFGSPKIQGYNMVSVGDNVGYAVSPLLKIPSSPNTIVKFDSGMAASTSSNTALACFDANKVLVGIYGQAAGGPREITNFNSSTYRYVRLIFPSSFLETGSSGIAYVMVNGNEVFNTSNVTDYGDKDDFINAGYGSVFIPNSRGDHEYCELADPEGQASQYSVFVGTSVPAALMASGTSEKLNYGVSKFMPYDGGTLSIRVGDTVASSGTGQKFAYIELSKMNSGEFLRGIVALTRNTVDANKTLTLTASSIIPLGGSISNGGHYLSEYDTMRLVFPMEAYNDPQTQTMFVKEDGVTKWSNGYEDYQQSNNE